MEKKLVGKVTHFYHKISVAIVEVSAPLNVGDKISIEKEGEPVVEQAVESMQIEHKAVTSAKKGDAIGMKVKQPVKENSDVYKIA